MKIGILTYHRSHNYGALLQAIALRLVLKDMGHKVTYIDYWPKYHQRMYALPRTSRKYCLFHPRFAFRFYRDKLLKVRRIKKFEQFKKEFIYPYCSRMDDEYDVLVYGSDQIWRKQPFINAYNPIYFGDNQIKAKKHIAYAASSDQTPQSNDDRLQFQRLLTHLDSISVREESILRTVHELGRKDAVLTLDPTLLLPANVWSKEIPTSLYKGEKYILWYELQPNSFEAKEVYRFADSIGCNVKILKGTALYTKNKDIDTTSGPEDFLKYIRNAEYVLTSSFHGLVFSISFHKPFIVSFSSNSDRAKSLLQLIGHSERMIEPHSKIPDDNNPIDYENVDKIIEEYRKYSISFLLSNIESVD